MFVDLKPLNQYAHADTSIRSYSLNPKFTQTPSIARELRAIINKDKSGDDIFP